MTKIVCPRCNHTWEYSGEAWWITCPKCRKMVKNEKTFEKARVK